MTNQKNQAVSDDFSSLRIKFRNNFKKQIREIWWGIDDVQSVPTQYSIDQSLLILERNVQMLIYRTVPLLQREDQTDANFATFNVLITRYMTDIEQVLISDVSLSTKIPSLLTTDNSRLEEVRRRIERQMDSYKPSFVTIRAIELKNESPAKRRGPPEKYDWFEPTHYVWIQIYRGILVPKTREDVIEAFQEYYNLQNKKAPSESTISPFVSPIWTEVDPNNPNDN